MSLVVGKKGTGKTTLVRYLVRRFRGAVFICDYLGEYNDLASERVYVRLWRSVNDFMVVTRAAWQAPANAQKMVVLDEIEFLCLDKKQKEVIEFLYRLGRHRRIDIVSVSHRFYMIPVICRALTDVFYLFRLSEPRDLAYLTGMVEPEDVERIKVLPDFNYVVVKNF